jgi:hypothetical protein
MEVQKNESVQVVVRCRPLNGKEKAAGVAAAVTCLSDKGEVRQLENTHTHPASAPGVSALSLAIAWHVVTP